MPNDDPTQTPNHDGHVCSTAELGCVPLHKMPLCDCADKGSSCLGRQPDRACMAHDKWYLSPCDKGQCPGPMEATCCRKEPPDAWIDELDD